MRVKERRREKKRGEDRKEMRVKERRGRR